MVKSPIWSDKEELGAYLSDDSNCEWITWNVPIEQEMYDDVIQGYAAAIVEDVSPYKLVPVIVNIMWLAELNEKGKSRAYKTDLVVDVLELFPQLKDTRYLHYSIVSKLYGLADTDNLLPMRRPKQKKRCCCI